MVGRRPGSVDSLGFNLIFYAAQTSSRSTLRKIREIGAGLLYSTAPGAPIKIRDLPYCIDNGAWHAYKTGRPWCEDSFFRAIDRFGRGSDWIMLPDIVENHHATLELAHRWIPKLKGAAPLYMAIQDGANGLDIPWDKIDGIALGGSTEYKERTMAIWGSWARARGLKFHVLRVNTARRIAMAIDARADSCDGSGVVQFPTAANFRKLANALGQAPILPALSEEQILADMTESAIGSGQIDRIRLAD